MAQVLLVLVIALTVAAVVFGVTVLVSGRDAGLASAEPDGRAVPLPGSRPLRETDVGEVRFDTALRGYRMAQVDQAMRRAAYDIGYKAELIGVLEAEVAALREGRLVDADALRRAREEAAGDAPATDPVRGHAGAAATPAYGSTDAPRDGEPGAADPDVVRPLDADRPAADDADRPLDPPALRTADAGAPPEASGDAAPALRTAAVDADPRSDGTDSQADPAGGRPGDRVRSESL
ncbi:DivIVA domain-containing protein [Micromonospora purpureochromogenes]|uniref:DivIVA domain-containing protein n=1 Tax=Micromonospora purpureochromogenes TaxID=47872 RepID=A0ABX2RKR7_9ACTN|nr:DivIVA domain-containing protein [Micromonospora purpureochromogenes]NYF56710.1 DivIVA domain-containing protein [Micromonospora purpureochromogenes]